jgi:pyocin large subunit-like protein
MQFATRRAPNTDSERSPGRTPAAARWVQLQRSMGNTAIARYLQREFTSTANRSDHFTKHGSDFPGLSESQYEARATSHFANRASFEQKVVSGKTYVYDPATDTFGSYTSGGKCITLFTPGHGDARAGKRYWNKQ